MKRALGFFLFALLLSNTLYAQSEVQTSIETATVYKKNPVGFQLEINPLFRFNGSYSFGASYDVTDKLNTEVSITRNNMANKTYPGLFEISSTTSANTYGLRLNYFPFATIQSGGFYTSIAAGKVNVKSTITGESWLQAVSETKHLSKDYIGRQLYAGYRFTPKNNRAGLQMTSRLGLGYGDGEEYTIHAGWKEYEIKDSVLVDATFLFVF